QMLGGEIRDPQRLESNQAQAQGIGLLPTQTQFLPEKATFQVRAVVRAGSGWFRAIDGQPLEGYEIHMGETTGSSPNWLQIVEQNHRPVHLLDGSASADGRIWGCYLHGIFGNDAFRHAWLKSLGWEGAGMSRTESFENSLNALAGAVENALGMEKLERIVWGK
ncbi:MAG: hypothetical protein EHM21_12325, partial [Chloroflexi bacterium]